MSGNRPGKRERKVLREAQMSRKAIISANLQSPVERNFYGSHSSASRNTLLGNTHTMGFHSSSIRGHKEGAKTSRCERWSDK